MSRIRITLLALEAFAPGDKGFVDSAGVRKRVPGKPLPHAVMYCKALETIPANAVGWFQEWRPKDSDF